MAVPNIGRALTMTMDAIAPGIADNMSNQNILLWMIKKMGNIKPWDGGEYIRQNLRYTDDTYTGLVDSYSGMDTLALGANNGFDAARYSFAQYAAPVLISGRDMLINQGEAAVLDYLEEQITSAKIALMDRIDYDIALDGTGNGGKNLLGLAAIVADTPTNTVGGISGSTYTWWKNQVFSGVTDGGAAVSAANIQSYMTTLMMRLIRNQDGPDMILAGADYYQKFSESLSAIQRVTNEDKEATGGFAALRFSGAGKNVPVIMGGGIGTHVPSTKMQFLNSKYLHWRPHKSVNFTRLGGKRVPMQQDAEAYYFGWAGNLTCSGRQFQGKLVA